MSERVDSVVIGAGVVGLAVARALAQAGREVVVLERNARIGEETSSRNSEVIHAGLYYPTDSLKAKFCVDGKERLYAFCRGRGIAHDRCGKLVVAIDEPEIEKLEAIAAQAARNGVGDLAFLDAAQVREVEPGVRAVAGLWSPSSGIVDAHELMLAMQADVEAHGGSVAIRSEAVAVDETGDALRITVRCGRDEFALDARRLVNAAGLGATRIAKRCPGEAARRVPETRFAKGSYFSYSGPGGLAHLVYPIPAEGGLGIHATLDLEGRLRFGPDVQWIDDVDYMVDESRAPLFYDAIRAYWPALPDGSLHADYCGVRPKIAGPGEPPPDFHVSCDTFDSGARIVHLAGIESPGLTASLAIADHVRERLTAP